MAHSAEFTAAGFDLGHDVAVRVWTPDSLGPDDAAPPLLAHDGPEYDDRSKLTTHINSLIQSSSVVSHRVALVDRAPGAMRSDWYGASPAYHNTLAHSVIPTIRKEVNVAGPIVGIGASLGAISLLGCEFEHPGTFGGLRLQSASFHHTDYYEPWVQAEIRTQYEHFERVAALVVRIRSTQKAENPIPIGITWRDGPERRGNIVMANILSDQGHLMRGGLVPGGHDFESWGNTFEPALAFALNRTWGYPQ